MNSKEVQSFTNYLSLNHLDPLRHEFGFLLTADIKHQHKQRSFVDTQLLTGP